MKQRRLTGYHLFIALMLMIALLLNQIRSNKARKTIQTICEVYTIYSTNYRKEHQRNSKPANIPCDIREKWHLHNQ